MSSPKSYLPMLTGLMLGDAISDHDGISCYPAIHHSSGEKYILKVISVPAAQVQMDALLLTGAFPNREAALEYYMDVSQDILRETEVLRQLSHQEGFIPYLDSQIIAKDNFNGYDVYLLSNFRYSLAQIFQNQVLTHKQIIQMALDLCAALAACRREGYVYIDLKPENIFYSEGFGYRIGDVGFASLASLPYASLPVKYHSTYTAPELRDEMAVLNTTADVYALGLILYQAYNGGTLPATDDATLPAPLYADYELADIILKACHCDVSTRWGDPTALAQAILSYVQRNPVSEDPIIPAIPETTFEDTEDVEDFLPEADAEQLAKEMSELDNTEYEDMVFVSSLSRTHADENEPNVDTDPSLEITDILAQADDLIAHELPQPAVAPEPIDVPMPERIHLDPDEVPEHVSVEEDLPAKDTDQAQPFVSAIAKEENESENTAVETDEPLEIDDIASTEDSIVSVVRPFPWRILVTGCILFALLAATLGGYYFYRNFYLQRIDNLVITEDRNIVSVHVSSTIDNSLLTVICADSYGNTYRQSVVSGIAVFPNLEPQTHYSIRLEVSGWHKLTGLTTGSITTAPQTRITELVAEIGSQDGSVKLRFDIEGPQTDMWVVYYHPTGHIASQNRLAFQGNEIEIPELEIGVAYTFTLSRADGLSVSGKTQVECIATKIIVAQNLRIDAYANGNLTILWDAPEDAEGVLWTVRCYNESGYDQSITTTELSAAFTGLNHDVPHTVEIFVQHMPQHASITIPANPITVDTFCATKTNHVLHVSWAFFGEAPADGWILECIIDDQPQISMTLSSNSAELPWIPCAKYDIRVQAAGAPLQFGGNWVYESEDAEVFDQWGIHANTIQGMLCVRPETENWTATDITDDLHTSSFTTEQQAGLVLYTDDIPEEISDSVQAQFVIRDASGNLISVNELSLQWDALWSDGSCVLNIPALPLEIGEYTVSLYFNGKLMGQWTFSITETT